MTLKDIFYDYYVAAIPAVLSKNPTNKVILHKEKGASVSRSFFGKKLPGFAALLSIPIGAGGEVI
ncbi:hypothetical protein [Flavobacterium ardleyense]|uniref:hypothetical protein n=1 Tax=Flavobacterium ardleyense TaxID=2038737 RepID=UPI00298CB4B6|nr:hypothetical protein [Flavobacterium ardleyense]